MQPAPLRTLNDVLIFARFQFPNFADKEKWGNRIKCNLIYYQSNYILAWIIILLLVGLFHPVKMMLGSISVSALFFLQKLYQNPSLAPAVALLGVGILFYHYDSVFILFFSIFLAISATLIHATLRLRGLDNKIENIRNSKSENVTPMELLLSLLFSLQIFQQLAVLFQGDQNNQRQTESELNEEICEYERGIIDQKRFVSSSNSSAEDVKISSKKVDQSQSQSTRDKNISLALGKVVEGLDTASVKLGALSRNLKKKVNEKMKN